MQRPTFEMAGINRTSSRLKHTFASAVAFSGMVALLCCAELYRGGGGVVVLQQQGGVLDVHSSLKALQLAFADGFAAGERKVTSERAEQNGMQEQLGRQVGNRASALEWIHTWDKATEQQALDMARERLLDKFHRAQGLRGDVLQQEEQVGNMEDHGDEGDEEHGGEILPSWQEHAFRSVDVPVRSRLNKAQTIETILHDVAGLEAEKVKRDAAAKKKDEEEKKKEVARAKKALEEYYSSLQAHDKVPSSHQEHTNAKESVQQYYAEEEKSNVVPKSHLAHPEDPKKYEEYEHKVAEDYFKHPETVYKMFYDAEHGDMKSAAKEYEEAYPYKQSRDEGGLYPLHPHKDEDNAVVDVSKDGDASSP